MYNTSCCKHTNQPPTSFVFLNSQSYKASTKALKTLDQERWDTRVRTPDKSILREKKRAAEAAAGTSEKKKKASGRKRRAKKGQS